MDVGIYGSRVKVSLFHVCSQDSTTYVINLAIGNAATRLAQGERKPTNSREHVKDSHASVHVDYDMIILLFTSRSH